MTSDADRIAATLDLIVERWRTLADAGNPIARDFVDALDRLPTKLRPDTVATYVAGLPAIAHHAEAIVSATNRAVFEAIPEAVEAVRKLRHDRPDLDVATEVLDFDGDPHGSEAPPLDPLDFLTAKPAPEEEAPSAHQ